MSPSDINLLLGHDSAQDRVSAFTAAHGMLDIMGLYDVTIVLFWSLGAKRSSYPTDRAIQQIDPEVI